MLAFVRKISAYLVIPIGWTVLTITLLCLPGSAIPKGGIYSIPNLDKLFHFVLFGILPVFWAYYAIRKTDFDKWRKFLVVVTLASIALGIALEFIQYYFIPNRDFDVKDIFADALGAIVFAGIVRYYEKAPAMGKGT